MSSTLGGVKFLRMQARAARENARPDPVPENGAGQAWAMEDSESTKFWNAEAEKFDRWADEIEAVEEKAWQYDEVSK